MPKQLNVSLGFTADTSKARQQIQDLQRDISNLMKATSADGKPLKITGDLQEASLAAGQLKQMLDSATNVNTGKLDLGKFSMQMKQSGLDLNYFKQNLTQLGPQGEKTFLNLTKAISQSEFTLNRTKGLVNGLFTTLKNTARWQLSSSMLHGFMGTIQSAYGYAQDLNESLNKIRIVTGASVEEMDRFAEKANKAARALSATTTEYTNAALIFYQQGLSDSEVEERTNATIKMSHAAGESATEVSSYMTAIWNNFADGSKELEYYGDVMTALGAKTAASSAEIAEGLEKFASIGETVGLSYEYASAAIATVVDKTRQSADTVGTAFKTIFSRLQGLQLGETLEDGTDLNKYSKALLAVGINIKDANGELKDMDDILDEMGAKWQTLHRDEQMALAQTVAGVRQYTQLMSLMNNYDDFKGNVFTAETSAGTLDAQAETYAESWEAAQNRVRAASEALWSDLLNDDFFIGMLNGFEKLLTGVDMFVDSIGGVPGLLSGIGMIATSLFGEQLAATFNNLQMDIMALMGKEDELRQKAQEARTEILNDRANTGNDAYNLATRQSELEVELAQADLRGQLLAKSKGLSQQEMEIIQILMDQNEQLGEQVKRYAEIEDAARHAGADIFDELVFDVGQLDGMEEAQEGLEAMAQDAKKCGGSMSDYRKVLMGTGDQQTKFAKSLQSSGLTQKQQDAVVKKLCQTYREMGQAHQNGAQSMDNFKKQTEGVSNTIQNGIPKVNSFGTSVVNCMAGISRLSMGINSLRGAWNTLNNPDLSGMEKFLQLTTSISMGLPMLISGFKATRTAILETTVVQEILTAITNKRAASEVLAALATMKSAEGDKKAASAKALRLAAEKLGIEVSEKATIAEMKKALIEKLGLDTSKKITTTTILEAAAHALNTGATAGEAGAKGTSTIATIAQTVANWGLLASMPPLLAITLIFVAALIALAAIVFVVVSAVQAITAKYNEDAIAAENAANAAKNLAEAYNEVKEEYNSMIAAMENYQSAREGLESLTKGTQEYREALNQANEAALELIKLGNLVKDEDYTIENGEIIIKDEAMQEAKTEKFNEMQEAYAASTMAQAKAAQAKAKSDQTDLVRKNDAAAVGVGTAAGAAVGSFFGPWGTAIGAAVGAIGGAIYNGIDNANEQARIDELAAKYAEIGEAAFDAGTLQELGFDTSNEAYINSIKDVVRATDQAAAQMEVAAQIAAQAVLEQDKAFQASEHQDKISQAAGKGYQSEYEKAYEDYMAKTKNNDWFGAGSKENKDAMAEYAKQMGLDQLNGYKVTNFKKGGNVEYEYIDENGEKQTKEITQQQIAAQLAATDATKQLEEQTKTLLNAFNRLETSTDSADKALSDFAGGDLSNATMSEFKDMESDLSGYITTDEDGNRQIAEGTDITQYIKDNFSEEEIAALGYASAEEMATAFKTQFNANLAAWDSVEVPSAFANMGIDMSLKTAQALENTFKEINLGPAGAETAQTFSDTFTEALSGLSASDQQKALEQLMTIDWSDWDAMDQAADIMEEFGKNIDTSSEEWKQLTSQMRLATGAVPDFSKLKDDLNAVSGILNDLDFGSTISEEDYQRLVAYNDEWERFFMLQADGSRMFIGDAEAMRQQTRDNIREQQKDLEARKAAQQGFRDANWGHQGENGWELADWENKSGSDTATATNLLNATGATETALEELGYTDEVIQDMITKATSGQADLVAEGEAQLREMYQRIGQFQEEDLNEMDAQFDEMMASTAGTLNELLSMQGEISAEAYDKQLTVLANSATSLEELQRIQMASLASGEGLDTYEYGEALIKLAENYDNCSEEIEKYNEALLSGDSAQIAAAQSALELSVEIGEMAEKFNLDAEETENYAKRLAKNLQIDEKAAAKLAVANQRLDRGLLSLNQNLEDYQDALKKNSKNSADWSKAMDAIKTDLADIFNLADGNMLSDEFAEATLASDDFKKALDGDVEALKRLQTAAADDIIATIKANIEGEENMAAFQSNWDYLKANMQEALKPNVDQTELIAAFNDMIAKGNMTKEQIEAALAGLHVSANVKTNYVAQKVTVPTTITDQKRYITGYSDIDTNMDGVTEKVANWRTETQTHSGPPVEVDGYVPQYTIEGTEGEGGITTAFTAAPSPTISHGSTTSGSSGGGGGGGGGGDKENNSEETKDPADEKDRYRVIKNKIEDLTAIYENLSSAKDKAFGRARLAALNQEIDAQRKLNAANKTYLNQIESHLASDKSALIAKASQYGGASFDENGTLTNYDALMDAAVKKYNDAVVEFNKHTTDDESAKKVFEAAQEEYDAFLELMDQYDETHDLWLEQMQTVLDDIMEEQALILERTQLEVELKINVSEDALQYLEYMMDNIENKAYDCAEAFSYLNSMTGQYINQQAAYTQGIYDIMGNKGISPEEVDALIKGDQNVYDKLMGMLSSGGTADLSDGLSQDEIDAAYGFTSDDIDTLRDYVSGLIEANQNLQEVRQTVHEQILTVWDEWNEKMDDGIAKLEHLQAISDSYKNIIDIVGQRNLGVSDAFMNKLEQQATTQAKDKVTAAKAKRDALQQSYENAKATYEEQLAKNILSPEEIKQWEDSLKQMEEDVQSASEEFQSSWEDALTAAQEQFEASVDRILAAYDDAAAGLMGSMSELQEAFDMKSDLSSQYLADYEKIYQINKLNREIENSVDATNNVKAKQELLELQSKINAYEEAGVEISEYQMEQLRQEYELKKAQIALEEAQSAKSEVQMTRDAEGNYSYVYTANTEDVAKAEQSYEDKLYAMQRSNADYINDLQSNMIQLEQDYQDKVKEIMTDTSLTAEERMVKLNELNEFYDQKMKFYMSEAELWQENSSRLYEEDWSAYAAATGYKISAEEDWVDHWEETQLAVLTGFTSLAEYYANHNENVATLLTSSSEALSTWQLNIEEIMEEAGTSISGFEEDATTSLDNVAAESEKTKDSVVDMADTAVTKMGEVVTAVANWENEYSKSVQNILAQNNALITSFNQVIAGWSNYTSATGSGGDSGGGSGTGSDSGNSSNGTGDTSGDTGNTTATDNSDKIAGVAGAIWFYSNSGWGTGDIRKSRLKEKGVTGAQAYINAHADNGDIYREWQGKESQLKKYFYGSFDTGGYTGEWGDDSGRFAMLHQKEIVLNADDTENFLKTVDMVRQISEMIDLNAMSSAGGLNSLFAATSSNLAQTLQQEVTIHAEFPNATDKDQITEAFSDLINLASQYASRKL